ncbi:hypothetical protein [Planctomicrobium piriforme]|uniref:hypothetical protein n=1 Tax=Planctomicrobium piriforme TaxID=1576369 RepID=UPI001113E300|nr:hypothetical protein [Planctomicrobium piriforme]
MLFIAAGQVQADVPEKLKKELNSRLEKDQQERQEAKAKLLSDFDDALAKVRQNKRFTPEDRATLLASIELERATFDKTGCVPFSPVMRVAMQNYVGKVSSSDRRTMQVYDDVIRTLTNAKEDQAAAAYVRERAGVPLLIGRCRCQGANFDKGKQFHWYFYSDFTMNRFAEDYEVYPKYWVFKGDKIEVTNHAAHAPKEGFKDLYTFHDDGQMFEGRNQFGAVYVGHRAE